MPFVCCDEQDQDSFGLIGRHNDAAWQWHERKVLPEHFSFFSDVLDCFINMSQYPQRELSEVGIPVFDY